MLEKPSINELTEKLGESRYTTALLVAKRARQIADKRIETESDDIKDCVEVATQEFMNDETKEIKEGEEEVAVETEEENNEPEDEIVE